MAHAVLGTLDSAKISEVDIARLRHFIEEDEASNLSLVMRAILSAIEDGVSIDVFADDAEVTPNEAARLLKMSRPHLLKFMREGYLPFHMVGTHKRIKMSDLREFMKAREKGAEILATAIIAPQGPEGQPLTQDELDELKDL